MKRTLCAILFLALFACNFAGAATKYVMKDLGTLPGDDQSSAEAINSKGQIVCKSWKVTSERDAILPKARALLWENGKISEINAPVGKDGVCILDINDSGTILVSGWQDSFIVEKGKVTKIEPLPGKTTIRALEINNRGDIFANGAKAGTDMELLVRRVGVTHLFEKPAGCSFIHFNAMNNKGQVAVNIEKADGTLGLAMWEDGKVRVLDGVSDGLCVSALSDDGTIAGMCDDREDGKGGVWRNGSMRYLQVPAGLEGVFPECINSKGVVGGMSPDKEIASHAVVWDANGVPTELPMPGGLESEVGDINDAGIIVGTLVDEDGRSRAVMWTPVK